MVPLLVVGSSNTDMTVRLPSLPAPGQTVLGGELRTDRGGKGANQAVAASRAGGAVTFVTALGDDAFAVATRAHLESEGLDLRYARSVPGVASGVALIFVGDDGENMIGVAPGANARLDPGAIDALPAEFLAPGGMLLIAGLEVPLATARRAALRASGRGMTVVLNPAPVGPDFGGVDLLSLVSVVTPNRGELGLLTGRPVGTAAEVAEAAWALQRLGPRAVVVTLGEKGCLVLDGTGDCRGIPAHRVPVVDTVGAGDAFNGALAVALAEGRPLVEAASWAMAAAALAVGRPGAQAALPRRPEIDRQARTSLDTRPHPESPSR